MIPSHWTPHEVLFLTWCTFCVMATLSIQSARCLSRKARVGNITNAFGLRRLQDEPGFGGQHFRILDVVAVSVSDC
jgi:hypothetical protein